MDKADAEFDTRRTSSKVEEYFHPDPIGIVLILLWSFPYGDSSFACSGQSSRGRGTSLLTFEGLIYSCFEIKYFGIQTFVNHRGSS